MYYIYICIIYICIDCQVYKAISISNPLLSYSVTPSPPNPESICKPFEDWQDWRGCSTSCGPGMPWHAMPNAISTYHTTPFRCNGALLLATRCAKAPAFACEWQRPQTYLSTTRAQCLVSTSTFRGEDSDASWWKGPERGSFSASDLISIHFLYISTNFLFDLVLHSISPLNASQ